MFEKRKKAASDRSKLARTSQPLGPTPFTGLSNYAAMMMSAAMSRQAAQPQPGLSNVALSTQANLTFELTWLGLCWFVFVFCLFVLLIAELIEGMNTGYS